MIQWTTYIQIPCPWISRNRGGCMGWNHILKGTIPYHTHLRCWIWTLQMGFITILHPQPLPTISTNINMSAICHLSHLSHPLEIPMEDGHGWPSSAARRRWPSGSAPAAARAATPWAFAAAAPWAPAALRQRRRDRRGPPPGGMERGRQRPRKSRKISGNLQKLGVFHGQNGLLMFEAKHGGETSKRQKVVEARNMAKKNETGERSINHLLITNLDAPASRRTWQIFKGHYSQMSYQSYHSQRHNFNSPPDPACNPWKPLKIAQMYLNNGKYDKYVLILFNYYISNFWGCLLQSFTSG